MTRDEHIKHHELLHKALDELLADYMTHTGFLPSKTSVMDLLQWSFRQIASPTPQEGDELPELS